MFKNILTYCSIFLCLGFLLFSHLEQGTFVLENLETQDVEVKLEGEKEEMIASLHLIELNQQQFLYQTFNFKEPNLIDYVVYLTLEDKPPRFFS